MLQRVRASKNLALLRHEAERQVDSAADLVRLRFATGNKHQIYADKRDEAERFLEAVGSGGTVTADDYPYLAAETQADPEVVTDIAAMAALAQTWLALNRSWKRVAARIERISIKAKADARNARGQGDLDRIVAEARDALADIGTPLPERPKPDHPHRPNPNKPKTGDFNAPGSSAASETPGV